MSPINELRTIIVTGASSGIGAHCARALKAEGWRVFATARKPEDIAALEADGIEALYLDYTESTSIEALVATVLERTGGRLDALFNNGAYRVTETRTIWFRRTQSIFFVLIATISFVAISVLLVFAPIIARILEAKFEWIKPYMGTITVWRFSIASAVIVFGLFAVHLWLPDGRRRFLSVIPGIIFTLVAWLIGSTIFAAYLDTFAAYVTTYAGLASIMIAIVFLYIISAIFILGGELNAAISRYLEARARVPG